MLPVLEHHVEHLKSNVLEFHLSHTKPSQNQNLYPNQPKPRSMTSKRRGKKIESSESGESKKQSTARNHGIQFKDQEKRNMYNSLISRTISPCRYPDVNSMDILGIDKHVIRLLNSQPYA